jgi:hypothetical protein
VEVEFLDRQANPIQLDLDNDDIPESSSFFVDAAGSSQNGEFFVELSPSTTFEELVPQIAVVPIDVADRRGERRLSRLTTPPVRSRGQSCDPRGFTTCATGLICTPGDPNAVNTCQLVTASRATECMEAEVLGPASGKMSMVGFANGSSAWEPPQGCAAHDPTGRPEGVAYLSLPDAASRVVITTDLPGTTFDTLVYVVGACDDDAAIACNDDVFTTASSRLVLENVPAHDYLIVIDSYDPGGGVFELEVSVE